jgi:hypothetical protein
MKFAVIYSSNGLKGLVGFTNKTLQEWLDENNKGRYTDYNTNTCTLVTLQETCFNVMTTNSMSNVRDLLGI